MSEDEHPTALKIINGIGRCLHKLIGEPPPNDIKLDHFIRVNQRKYRGVSGLHKFLIRCFIKLGVTIQCFILALILVDKSCAHTITQYNIHNMIGTALMIAAKMHDDDHLSNRCFAGIIGVSLKDLNYMEIEFVRLLHFNAAVDVQTYSEYHDILMRIN